jgi:hypothetical protein
MATRPLHPDERRVTRLHVRLRWADAQAWERVG